VRRERPGPTEGAALASAPPPPQGAYIPALATEALVLTAGMTPRTDGNLEHVGRVGAEVSLDDARAAAAIAASNAVAAASSAVGGRAALRRALRLTVYIVAVDGFTDHSLVADGASGRLLELLGPDAGVVVRSAVGVQSLPGGACVEVELTCERTRTGNGG
jgi:enamine deaminase RidA (YjgF/YER057c/UK114 family)